MVALSSAWRGGGVLRVYSGSPTCQSLCCVKEGAKVLGEGFGVGALARGVERCVWVDGCARYHGVSRVSEGVSD